MEKKNYFILFFFILLTVFSLFKLYDNLSNLDAWEYGEWLINYQQGFIRRGIIGEIIYQLSYILSNNIQLSFFLILSFFCSLYYYLNFLFLKNIKFNVFHYFIFFSPLFYLFFVLINGVGVRKEIILYIYYLIYLINLSSKNFTLKKNWKFIFSFPIVLFVHEGLFFYLPYMCVPLLFIIKKEDLKYFIYQSITLFILSTAIMLILYVFKGTYDQAIGICQSLGNFAPINCDEWGPIYSLQHEILRDQTNKSMLLFYLEADYKSWLGYLVYIVYSFTPIVLFYRIINFESDIVKNNRFYLLLILISIAFSLPLFNVAEDWSRWFSIHFHLMVFLIFFFQRIGVIIFNNNILFEKFNYFFVNKKIFCFVLFLIYSTFLHHEEYFAKNVKLDFTYIKIIKKLSN